MLTRQIYASAQEDPKLLMTIQQDKVG